MPIVKVLAPLPHKIKKPTKVKPTYAWAHVNKTGGILAVYRTRKEAREVAPWDPIKVRIINANNKDSKKKGSL